MPTSFQPVKQNFPAKFRLSSRFCSRRRNPRRNGQARNPKLKGEIPASVGTVAGAGGIHDLKRPPLISTECSILGHVFQEKYHIPKLPSQTVHVKAANAGHFVLTLN